MDIEKFNHLKKKYFKELVGVDITQITRLQILDEIQTLIENLQVDMEKNLGQKVSKMVEIQGYEYRDSDYRHTIEPSEAIGELSERLKESNRKEVFYCKTVTTTFKENIEPSVVSCFLDKIQSLYIKDFNLDSKRVYTSEGSGVITSIEYTLKRLSRPPEGFGEIEYSGFFLNEILHKINEETSGSYLTTLIENPLRFVEDYKFMLFYMATQLKEFTRHSPIDLSKAHFVALILHIIDNYIEVTNRERL